MKLFFIDAVSMAVSILGLINSLLLIIFIENSEMNRLVLMYNNKSVEE